MERPEICTRLLKWQVLTSPRYTAARTTVLPGPDVASPPTQQKSTAIWRKFAATSNFPKIPLLFRYFWSFPTDLQLK
jgi:hypothetical protein